MGRCLLFMLFGFFVSSWTNSALLLDTLRRPDFGYGIYFGWDLENLGVSLYNVFWCRRLSSFSLPWVVETIVSCCLAFSAHAFGIRLGFLFVSCYK